jgi:hypothetical protein
MRSNDARHALLTRLIDHAPMFPPASLPEDDALAADALAVESRHAFMLGRLVWPASALDAVSSSQRELSVVLDALLPDDLPLAAVEARWRDDLDELAGLADEVYVEVPIDDALDQRLDALAGHELRAKVRCGGAAGAPSQRDLARFVRSCRERGLAFKATAGLHHAVRNGVAHGFLNLLAAAAFAEAEERTLEETDSSAFALDAGSFAWRDRSASADELARVRGSLFHSVGSCSFDEPVDELQELGVLPS